MKFVLLFRKNQIHKIQFYLLFQKELAKQKRRLEEQDKAQKLMYKRMFADTSENNEPKKDKDKKSWVS